MNPSIGEGEARRQREHHRQSKRARRTQLWADMRRELIHGVRRVFVFLFVAAIAVFAVSHWTEINSVAAQKISRVTTQLKSPANPSALRQATLNYEKEVEDAAK